MRGIYFGGGSDMNGAELGTEWMDRLRLRFSKLVSDHFGVCLLYTSPSPRDRTRSRMPSSA